MHRRLSCTYTLVSRWLPRLEQLHVAVGPVTSGMPTLGLFITYAGLLGRLPAPYRRLSRFDMTSGANED